MPSQHENINKNVQLYACVLSEVLLDQNMGPHLLEVNQAITNVDNLISDHPDTRSYKKLKTELKHLRGLVDL